MFRAAWKSLLGRKVRLLMSTFAIVLGVAFVVGTLIFSDTLSRSFTAIFASSVGDVVVRPASAAEAEAFTNTTIPASVVDDLRSVDGAARVDGNVSFVGAFVIKKNENKVVGGTGAPPFGLSWSDAPAGHGLEGLQIVEGHEPRRDGEVVLDVDTAQEAGYQLGDQVRIVNSVGKQPVLTATMAGTADYGQGSLNGATMAIFTQHAAQQHFLGGKDAFNDVWVTAEDGVSQTELRDRVDRALPKSYDVSTGDDLAEENGSALMEAMSFLTTFLLIFAGISLVVGSFLIVNTFSILVAQRSRELALLRALGASKRQVTRSVMLEAVVLGLVGSTLGLGLGVLLAIGLEELFGNFGLDLSGTPMVFQLRTVGAAYLVGMLVTLVAAYLPARRTGRIPPVAALRDEVAMPEQSLRRRLVTGTLMALAGCVAVGLSLFAEVPRSGWVLGGGLLMVLLGVAGASPMLSKPVLALGHGLYRRIFGPVGNLAGQNTLRNPRRTAATASALMIGLALCTTMAMAGASMKASVDDAVQKSFAGDLVVSNLMGQGFSPSIANRIGDVDGVSSVSRMRFGQARLDDDGPEDERASLIGAEPDTIATGMNIEMLEGSMGDLTQGTLLVSEERRDDDGLAVGDELAFKTPAGERTLRVAGVYAENQLLSSGYLVGMDTFRAAGYPDSDNYLMIDLAPGVDRWLVQADVEEVVAQLPTVTVKDQQGFAEEQRGPIDQLLLLVYALLGLALVIAVLGIVNTLALSVIERTREVGLLRAIGVARVQLRRMITLESVAISVLGAILGVLLGLGFGIALMYSLRDQGLTVTEIPAGQVALFLALSVVIGVLAAVFPARRAARLDVLKAIATE